MSPILSAFLKSLLLPPGIHLLLILLGIVLYRRYRRLSGALIIIAFMTLYLVSTPFFSSFLLATVEPEQALNLSEPRREHIGAMVIPGCGRYANPAEYEEDDISECGLIRLRYAAELKKQYDIPILLSGGNVFSSNMPEAMIMNRILKNHFSLEARWLETKSRNTIENAIFSANILMAENIQSILLVTHASHMKRASNLYQKQGLHVIEAPTYFRSVPSYSPDGLAFMPSAKYLELSHIALNEILGKLYVNVFMD